MNFEWLNPPPVWSGDAARMEVETGDRTDFWRETFYGFTRDSGHGWLMPVDGDFTASVRFQGEYETLYDQAGLMILGAGGAWAKAGIEFTDGLLHFSVVVSAPRSDWSVIPFARAAPRDWISARLTRHGDVLRVQYAMEGEPWRMARLAPFVAGTARVGLMAASPERTGFRARFEALEVGPAIPRDLHSD